MAILNGGKQNPAGVHIPPRNNLTLLGPDPESLPSYFRRVTSRSVTVMVVNDTKEQLELESDTSRLSRGKWRQDSMIPEVIPPGGSARWHCSSAHVAQGLEGAVTY